MSHAAPAPVGAREVFDRFLKASVTNAMDDLADLYAADAVIEIPWTPDGVPLRSAGGREEIRARFRGTAAVFRIERADPVVVHETTDPETIVAEFDLHLRITRTGEVVRSPYVMVVRTRDGLIVHSRDYTDPTSNAAVREEIRHVLAHRR
jgi:uncharacterized protein